ncbi:MAG TPA: addiction module protein [Candidatus Acidoferrum sp.]
MTEKASNLLEKALTLTDEERAELASSLIDSLDPSVDEGAAEAWDQEIAQRVSDLDAGRAKTVPWEEVHRRIS